MTAPPLANVPLDRIAIVMMSAIGDAVHVLPVLTALKRHAPASRITWVLQSAPASLVRGHPALDEIILFDRRRGSRAFLDVWRELASRKFDLVLDLQVYIKAGIITALTRSQVKLGFDRARARDLNWLFTTHRIVPRAPGHVQDQYFEFLAALGVRHEPVEWNIGPWPRERESQAAFFAGIPRPVVALAIGSTHPQKLWLAERWAEVADILSADFEMQPVLLGGGSEVERETARVITGRARASTGVISTLGNSLREMLGIIEGAALVIALDSAPLHMAVAANTPVISLMGYNNPKRVGPYRRFQDLLIDSYGESGECYPVSLMHRLDRMRRITVRDVVDKIELWSSRYRDQASTRARTTVVG